MYHNQLNYPMYSQHVGSYQEYIHPQGPPQYYQQANYALYPPQQQVYQQQYPVQTHIRYPKPVPLMEPPPPMQPSKQVYSPNIPIVSWHPAEAKIQKPQQQYYQPQTQNMPNTSAYEDYERIRQYEKSQKSEKPRQRSNKSSRTSIKEDIQKETNTPKFATTKLAKMITQSKTKNEGSTFDKLIMGEGEYRDDEEEEEVEGEEEYGEEDDEDEENGSAEYSDLDDSELKERDDMRNKYTFFRNDTEEDSPRKGKKMDYEGITGLRKNHINAANRFETLAQYQKINKQHDNLFSKDFVEDADMDDLFKDNRIHIDRFDLQRKQKSVPSLLWQKTYQNMVVDESIGEVEKNSLDEDQEKQYYLWEARFAKIHEYDYLVSYSNNIFSRKSNYLKLGLFYKQAVIKHQFDRTKEIVYYMYTYDEYSIKKKKSEITQEDEQREEEEQNKHRININSLQQVQSDEEDEDGNYDKSGRSAQMKETQKSNKDVLQSNTQSKAKLGEPQLNKNNSQKSTVFNTYNKSRILNNSQMASSLKSKVLTTTTYNKRDVKSQIKDNYDFAKSNFLRDYEKIHGQAIKEEDEDEDMNGSKHLSKSYISQDKSNASSHSDNYSKLYKSRPAGQRKKVIERKEDDLSKIKNRHNKYKLWEKNAVSEDLFLDQVRDSTIEAVKRARNLEQAIVEKTSIFEHHAASLLNQHLSQLRKVSREYKQELYFKVREIIQFIYDEYREVINFESNSTYIMLVCDKKDNDRILGLHYHGYQGKKYFEKYFDEFVTYSRTKKDFEEKRYQAFLLNKAEESYCKQHFLG